MDKNDENKRLAEYLAGQPPGAPELEPENKPPGRNELTAEQLLASVTPPTSSPSRKAPVIITIVIIVVLMTGVSVLLHTLKPSPKPAPESVSPTPPAAAKASTPKDLLTYSLPLGWQEANCSNTAEILLLPPGTDKPDCTGTRPPAPFRIYIDPQKTTDCRQLQNAQAAKTHSCISLFVSGRRSLKSTDTFDKDAYYQNGAMVTTYYVTTASDVVRLEYTDSMNGTSTNYQSIFGQLINSTHVK